ncbi:Hypothetical protein I595_3606 [Croceitalea dokdonensis DOKDO 023]|uniref:Uncharacterized protein n=1 Tax=Croceitalea dokdonensis DOKDO 023 TaxID=1300341 RepID=A0A0P7ARD4_9FLAO|nr:Hypothetical protein I595_3606 [Croceitalea dokdonensis DOKDO 023]
MAISACRVSNPIENLAWLQTEIALREANQTEFGRFGFIT